MSTPPSPQTIEPDAPTRAPARRRWLLVGLAVVGLGTGAAGVALRHRGSAAEAAPLRDVPQLEGGAIVFSPAFRLRAGIELTQVERARFKPTVRVVGTVGLNPSYVAAVGTRLRGTVRRTYKYEGDRVEAGEALAEVESAELGEAQATITQAMAHLEAADRNAQRERSLLERQLTTAREAELAESELAHQKAALRAAQQRVRSLGGDGTFGLFVLRSPIAGHVVERSVSPGQSVDGTAVAYRVTDLTHLWVELSIFEHDLGFVHVGDDVAITPMGDPRPPIAGKVAHVGQVIDPNTRSAIVRVAVDDPAIPIRPGQSVHAVITSGDVTERSALLVPHEAVVYFDGKPTVFVGDGETRVRVVTVRLGASDGTRHEVLEGVEEGQSVATGGVFALKSELFR